MPVKEIIVLQKGGVPLFNFAPSGAPKLDALVAGFLSAQAGFAEEIGEGQIQVVSFANNKFIYESRAEMLFIVVIEQMDDEHVYRVILKEIAQSFEKQYKKILQQSVIPSHLFGGFREHVVNILAKYDRVPEVLPRHATAILPPEVLEQVESILSIAEGQTGIIRTALVTKDGFFISSKLLQHEIEVAAKQMQQAQNMELPAYFAVSQTTLEKGTKLLIHQVKQELLLLVIIREDLKVGRAAERIAPLVYGLGNLDLSNMVKVHPKTKETLTFFDHDVFTSNPMMESTLFAEQTGPAREFGNLFGNSGLDVLRAIDGVSTVEEVRTRTGVTGRQLIEIISYLTSRGYIRRVQFYPKLIGSDARFLTYLQTVGLTRDEYAILEQASAFSDGNNSTRDISQRIGVDEGKLVSILRKLGENVEWLT
ncbi:MAG: hypothetical protein ACFE89_03705 [Candidatus Hodarchaeota archaeon]